MQHSYYCKTKARYVIRGNVHIVYVLLDPGSSRHFKGTSKLLAQGSIPTREK